MSFEKFYLDKLQKKPSELESHEWADYLELLCIANIDGEISQSDIIDRLSIRQRDLKEGDTEEMAEDEMLDSDNGYSASNRARISDRWETNLKDWFRTLHMRSSLYGDSYPFKVDGTDLKLKANRISFKQRLYIYLLLCSNLYLFPKKTGGMISSAFEILSMYALKNILPGNAEIHLFGKNPFNTKGEYKSSLSLWEKINRLAEAIDESLTRKLKKEDYPDNNRGDDGLDIVAWIPTMDRLPSKIIFFGQCACGSDWKKKQHESSFDAWSNKMEFTNYPINSVFIPYCFRKSSGEWHKNGTIQKSFLVDRKRLLDFCGKDKKMNYRLLPVYSIIDTIVNVKEEVF